MNDKQWDDYVRRQPGTFWGEMGRKMDKSNMPNTQVFKSRSRKEQSRRPLNTKPSQIKAPTKPMFQWVDRFIERIPQFIRIVIKVALVILGAIVATVYSENMGVPTLVAAAAGAVAGYIVPTFLLIFVKLALLAGLIGFISAFLYVIYRIII